MDRIDGLRIFVRVVETTSFSRAARLEGVGQSTVSKHVAAIEKRHGAQLLRRTSRGMSLTDAGTAYYRRALDVLGRFDELDRAAGDLEPQGRLHVALPAAFGRLHVLPHLKRFLEAHSRLAVDTVISDRFANMIEDGIDLAVRIGQLSDSSLVARRIGRSETVLAVSADLAATLALPDAPADLATLPLVGFLAGGSLRPWTFSGSEALLPKAVLRTNDAEQVRSAVLAGLGVAQAPAWLFRDEIANGSVSRLLPEFDPQPEPIHAVMPAGRVHAVGVRQFTDILATAWEADPLLRLG